MSDLVASHGGCRYYMAFYRKGVQEPYKRSCTLTGKSCLYYPFPQYTCERKMWAERAQGWTTYDPTDHARPNEALFGP